MKFYIVILEEIDPKKKEAWDRYSRDHHKRPHGTGPRKTFLITNDPTRGGRRWKIPTKRSQKKARRRQSGKVLSG